MMYIIWLAMTVGMISLEALLLWWVVNAVFVQEKLQHLFGFQGFTFWAALMLMMVFRMLTMNLRISTPAERERLLQKEEENERRS